MWSDAARQAALEARRLHAKGKQARQSRASSSYKPSTQAKQQLAADSERRVAKMLGTKPTTNKAPFDAILKLKKLHAVEIKTLMDNKNDKITMHKDSLARKIAWAMKYKAEAHTVVLDRRGNKIKLYYRRGVGSFRLSSLLPVRNKFQLRDLIV